MYQILVELNTAVVTTMGNSNHKNDTSSPAITPLYLADRFSTQDEAETHIKGRLNYMRDNFFIKLDNSKFVRMSSIQLLSVEKVNK